MSLDNTDVKSPVAESTLTADEVAVDQQQPQEGETPDIATSTSDNKEKKKKKKSSKEDKPRRKNSRPKEEVTQEPQVSELDSDVEIIPREVPYPVPLEKTMSQKRPGENRRTNKQRDRSGETLGAEGEEGNTSSSTTTQKKKKKRNRPRREESGCDDAYTTHEDVDGIEGVVSYRSDTRETEDAIVSAESSSYTTEFPRRDGNRFASRSYREQRGSNGGGVKMSLNVNVDMQFSGLINAQNLSLSAGQSLYSWAGSFLGGGQRR